MVNKSDVSFRRILSQAFQRGAGDVDANELDDWISNSLFDMFIWDFDMTIMKIHAWHEGIQSGTQVRARLGENVREQLKQDVADLDFFVQFVKRVSLRGKKVAIASFGSKETILAYLEAMGLIQFITPRNVRTPGDFQGYQDGQALPDKNAMIMSLLSSNQPPNAPPLQAVLYDDDSNNIMRAIMTGATAIWTPMGFTEQLWRLQASGNMPPCSGRLIQKRIPCFNRPNLGTAEAGRHPAPTPSFSSVPTSTQNIQSLPGFRPVDRQQSEAMLAQAPMYQAILRPSSVLGKQTISYRVGTDEILHVQVSLFPAQNRYILITDGQEHMFNRYGALLKFLNVMPFSGGAPPSPPVDPEQRSLPPLRRRGRFRYFAQHQPGRRYELGDQVPLLASMALPRLVSPNTKWQLADREKGLYEVVRE